jgi:LPS-assembly protein
LTPVALALTAAFVSLAVDAQSTPTEAATDAAMPATTLKPAPQLTPPPLSAPRGPASPAAPATTSPRVAAPFQEGTIFLRADRVDGVAEKFVEASGKVELRTRNETVLADWLRYDFLADEVWGKGDVLIRRGVDWVTGPELKFKRDTETGFFTSPRFYIGENASRGSASEIRFTGPNHYEASDARYTTCIAPRDDWYIRMDELEVDRLRMVGTGHDATLYFLGAPVMYSPWLEFPLSNERKSGFLTPVLGSSGIRGFEYAQPYYLNLAPNYDATITPRLMTKRGVQIAAQGRYLFVDSVGEATAEYLNNDRVTGEARSGVSWKHTQNLAAMLPGLIGYWNLNKVSDNTYFADLSDRVGLTSQTTLPREGGFVYSQAPWTLIARAQAFQTLLDPSLPPGPPPYNRVPQFLASMQEVDWKGLTFAGTAEYAYFRNSSLVTGQRAYAYPTVAWTKQGPAWYFTAATGVHARHYSLNDTTPDREEQNYAIPVSTLDAGLVFERDWSVFGENFVQTLEPRAYYVYVPFRDQTKAPVFDTAIDDFNFAQLYSPNRYLGNDRIGDANQVTVGLTSRLLDPTTGAERLRVAVGERFYFADQRVTLSEAPRSATSSDFLVGADGRLSDAWALGALMQYNFDFGQIERLDAGVRYTPSPGKAFNASYRYSRLQVDQVGLLSELKQFDLSTQWPITENTTFLGRWNYSLVDNKTLEAIVGIEYNAGCWVLRLVGQRLTTTTQTTSTSVYLQIELNGLARFGTNPLELLRRSVPGYQRTNDPTLAPRDREDLVQEF